MEINLMLNGLKETDTHIFFLGSYLSNFYKIRFKYILDDSKKEVNFDSSEQLFMWFKAFHFKDKNIANKILDAKEPNEAKPLGRKVKDYRSGSEKEFDVFEWDKVRYEYMLKALRAKFNEKTMKEALLDTGNKILVEGSPVDKVWGVGLNYNDERILDKSNWNGTNLLGKALMEVRDEIRKMK